MPSGRSTRQDDQSAHVPLPADRVREIVLVRAFEEADSEGRLLPHVVRERVSREVADNDGLTGIAVIRERASRLAKVLCEKFGAIDLLSRFAPRIPFIHPVALALAVLLGLSLNALGPDKQINVLSVPLLAVIVWNFGVYAWLLAEKLRGRASVRRDRARLATVFAWLSAPDRPWKKVTGGFEHEKLVADAVRRFAAGWWSVGRPLHRARIEALFHVGSALVALGAIVGMYVRGLALQYDLTWESTFLDQAGVQSIVSFVLGPADALISVGTALPAEGETASAAPWIHLYAVTALLFVVIPRSILFAVQARRAMRFEEDFPLDVTKDGYFLRLLAAERGEGQSAAIFSYSYRPSKLAEEGLRTLLLDVLGNRALPGAIRALDYGVEWNEVSTDARLRDSSCLVLLFNAAQSPEQEVHGHFLEGARDSLRERDRQVLVLVDESRYRERLGAGVDGERRISERRRAWERLVREVGFRAVFMPLEAPAHDPNLEEVREALVSTAEVPA